MTILLPSGVKLTPKSDDIAMQILNHMEGSVEIVEEEAVESEKKTSGRKKSAE